MFPVSSVSTPSPEHAIRTLDGAMHPHSAYRFIERAVQSEGPALQFNLSFKPRTDEI